MYRYITNFYLKGLENCKNKNNDDSCISNFIIKVNEFLQEDNMTLYLKEEIERKINKLINLNKDNSDNNNNNNNTNIEKFKKFYNKIENIKWEIVIVDNYEHKYIDKDGNIDNITRINSSNNINIIGLITVITNDILEYFEESFISNFISIQNSDGLGGSFSQEDFANDIKLSNEQIRISSRTLNGESINKYELKMIN